MNDSPHIRSPLLERNKKLINLSRQVLEHVRYTEKTTGNQIAKDIIKGFSDNAYDSEFKNIQRRVYDALNVLYALSIISKTRNEITYRGLADKDDLGNLRSRISERQKEVEEKRKRLGESVMQFIALHKLIRRNQGIIGKPSFIELPCLVVSGRNSSDLQFTEESVMISSDFPFKILSDSHILAEINLHKFTQEEINEHFPREIFALLDSSLIKTEETLEKDYRELHLKINNNVKSEL